MQLSICLVRVLLYLDKCGLLLNTYLHGLDLSEINLDVIQQIKMQSDGFGSIVTDILDAIAQAISEEDKVKVYTSGATNVFKYPELSDNHSAQEIINAFEEKQMLSNKIATLATKIK